ncbi:RNA polymerase recycling motor HelD [Robertmurraya andreesenii]|uniref:DNA helicase-2/ATP-dependent DNA helicase PcrA n=1 Tax=Anoxybacillus andreesenii TaxID=1325932 RepID=A0ABT9V1G7_9BACL|nr:RNA polymerase recycling motor HelD [Robertmurraya andreesenii]MDQ0154793.1 DNA helicase-2/ATP-dependent DNA helicase PcrA [Robertmurraya andreesenii]
MSEEQLEREQEQRRVQKLAVEIQDRIDTLSHHASKISSDAHEIRRTFWNDVTVNVDEPDDFEETFYSIKQQADLLSERERSEKQLKKTIKTLSRLKESPYFGRVDFIEDGESSSESIYLGITSFMDKEEQNFLIYDWRAPISSIYYDYAPGPAQYETPSGLIKGEMTLKRQFIIKDGRIEGMFDTGVTIGDQLLQEVLGNNANAQMKTIVATIQKEQNQIIRNEKNKYLIVQGVAGSGKTSAALQRVAYLLYRHRKTLSAQNIVLFSPNPLFNSYVSTVLPELGEENMQQTTFIEYLGSRIGRGLLLEDSFSQLEYLLNHEDTSEYKAREESIRLKSSLAFKEKLDDYIRALGTEGLEFKDISLKSEVLLSNEQMKEQFYSYEKGISLWHRMELLKDWAVKELRRRKRLERRKDWVKEEAQFLDKEDFLEAFKTLQNKGKYNEDSFNDFELEEKLLSEIVVSRYFKPIMTKVKRLGFVDYRRIYENFLRKMSDIYSLQKIGQGEIPYEDATPFVYLKDKIEGTVSFSSIRHIFVDEAQDYTPFQFAYFQELFPNSKMTLLGDINQGIFSHSNGVESFLPQAMEGEEERIILTKSYRSTRPIVEFTKRILKDGSHIEPFNRDGSKPTYTTCANEDELDAKVLELLKAQTSHKTVAIICRTAMESAAVYAKLKDHVELRLIEKGTITFERGLLVIPSYLAKGIEFDSVILYDVSGYSRESERRLLYTACTRAMHELHLFSTGAESPLLKEAMEYVEKSQG